MTITVTAGLGSFTLTDGASETLIATMNANGTNTLALTMTYGSTTYTGTLTGNSSSSSSVTVAATQLDTAPTTIATGFYLITLTDGTTTTTGHGLFDETTNCLVYDLGLACPDKAPLAFMMWDSISDIADCDTCTAENAYNMYPILLDYIEDSTNITPDGCNCD
jgi:hypothetical protein